MSTYYVDDVGTNGDGSLGSPWNKIQNALNAVVAGDTVNIRSGIYREDLLVQAGHYGSAGSYVTLQNYTGETPIIRGSDAVTGWVNHSGNIWKKTSWTTNSQQVFDDGAPLQQIGRPPNPPYNPNDGWDEYPNPVGSGLGDMAAGRFYYDSAAQTLYVQLTDNSNPNSSLMEASVRRRTFFADSSRGYIKLKGLTFEHNNSSAVAEQDALVTLSSNSIADGCTFRRGDFGGVSMGYQTTGVQVINSTATLNGDLGMQGPASYNFTIANNTITSNNYRNFNQQWNAGGIKITTGAYGLIDNNDIGSNNGSGVWFDYASSANTSTVRNNYIHDNGPEEAGIFFEASKHGVLYNNVLVNNNRRGIYVSGSDDTKVYNNTIVNQQGLSGIEVVARSGVNSTNTIVKNNIISGSTATRDLYMSTGTGNTSNYNDIYRASGVQFVWNGVTYTTLSSWQSATGFDMNSTVSNPSFSAPSGDNYALGSSSPAINTGTTLAEVTNDYVLTSRPQGSAYDMGAYEFAGALKGYWALNENTGTTTADSSGNGNTGTLTNGPTWVAPGQMGPAAINLDGTNDYVNVPDSSSLDVTSAMTISGWFYHNSSGGGGTTGVDKQSAYRLTAQEANAGSSHWQFFFTDTGGGTHSITTTNLITNNAWHHVAGTYNGTTLKLYVDGVSAATNVSYTGSIAATTSPLKLGVRDGTISYYAGKMDDVRVYNYALSDTEISSLASTLNIGLAARYRMDENTGTTAADASGYGNTGTLTNGPTWVAPGQVGTAALSFDGTNDYVNVADSSSLDVTSAMSIGGWFYHNSTGGGGTTGVDKQNAYRLTAQEANVASSNWQFFFTDSGSVTHNITTSSAVSNNAWHHIFATYDGASLKLYVDGASAATAVSFTGSIAATTSALRLGVRDGSVSYFAGKMDDIRVYNRALSATDVSSLYGGAGDGLMGEEGGGSSETSAPLVTDPPSEGTFSDSLLNSDESLLQEQEADLI